MAKNQNFKPRQTKYSHSTSLIQAHRIQICSRKQRSPSIKSKSRQDKIKRRVQKFLEIWENVAAATNRYIIISTKLGEPPSVIVWHRMRCSRYFKKVKGRPFVFFFNSFGYLAIRLWLGLNYRFMSTYRSTRDGWEIFIAWVMKLVGIKKIVITRFIPIVMLEIILIPIVWPPSIPFVYLSCIFNHVFGYFLHVPQKYNWIHYDLRYALRAQD